LFDVTIGLRKGKVPNKGYKYFSKTQPCHTSKDAELYVDFKKYNPTLVKKDTYQHFFFLKKHGHV
jgi:hypothetical protein